MSLPFNLRVMTHEGLLISSLAIDGNATTEDLMQMIENETKIACDLQRPMLAGKQLERGKTLAEQGVEATSQINRVVKRVETLNLRIMGISGVIIESLSIDSIATTEQLKQVIQKERGIEYDTQHPMLAGAELQDGKTLAEQGVTTDSQINLVVKRTGYING